MKEDFSSLRPYRDEEVSPVLRSLVRQRECVSLLTGFYLPRALRCLTALLWPVTRILLSLQAARIRDVHGLQKRLYPYVHSMLQKTSAGLSVSGLENLDRRPHLFISNHRDIAIDPVLIAYALWRAERDTMRIGFGDNLMHERAGYVTDLMRLNKGFVIQRSFADRRAAAAHRRLLSAYIRHSIVQEQQSVWIAQSNGRAKDGNDQTHAGLIRMLSLSGGKDFGAAIRSLCIVPVAISYEYDPCDHAKAQELYLANHQGSYDKTEDEDLRSIGVGITGWKGRMHVAFGAPLEEEFSDVEEVSRAIDAQIIGNYVMHPSNYLACHALEGIWHSGACGAEARPFRHEEHLREQDFFFCRIENLPKKHRLYALRMYANPLWNQQRLSGRDPVPAIPQYTRSADASSEEAASGDDTQSVSP